MDLPSVGACDLATLPGRVAVLNAQCFPSAGRRRAQDAVCTIACATVLLPLLDECRPWLDPLLDLADGVEDGVAARLDWTHDACLEIQPSDVLAQLKTMNDAGTCPESMLNNVALTDVTDTCEDARDGCDALLGAGLQCKDATMQTDCRMTCGLCDGHRRAQIVAACSPKDFQDDAATVNDACCDDAACNGVPTVCDAKCAIIYDDFYERCSRQLQNSIDPAQMRAWTALHATCSTQLPVEPLLRAVIACGLQCCSACAGTDFHVASITPDCRNVAEGQSTSQSSTGILPVLSSQLMGTRHQFGAVVRVLPLLPTQGGPNPRGGRWTSAPTSTCEQWML